MINIEDLKSLAEVGHALWVDPRDSELATVETLGAVTLLGLSPDRALERAVEALLDRAKKTSAAADTYFSLGAGRGLGQPFYRLSPEDRALLVTLHSSRWSYARLSRIFRQPIDEIERRVWKARLQLASFNQVQAYPAGAMLAGPHCPEYDSQRPWTQRFLDEEVTSGRERFFLQNHLMACESCREALARCREAYYAIDQLLPRSASDAGSSKWVEHLERVVRGGQRLRAPMERNFMETLGIFVKRIDVLVILAGLVVMIGAMIRWKL